MQLPRGSGRKANARANCTRRSKSYALVAEQRTRRFHIAEDAGAEPAECTRNSARAWSNRAPPTNTGGEDERESGGAFGPVAQVGARLSGRQKAGSSSLPWSTTAAAHRAACCRASAAHGPAAGGAPGVVARRAEQPVCTRQAGVQFPTAPPDAGSVCFRQATGSSVMVNAPL